jgi:DNA (cytosine-5)-methyltransferase 1
VLSRPRLLDLFACEGGASVGYARAGWDVLAVDMDANRLKRNPHAWHTADAFDILERQPERLFDAIHASPPCQGYTRGNAGKVTKWPKLIPHVREALEATGLPYVIENVKDAGPEMVDPVALCGCMFDLSVRDYSCTADNPQDSRTHRLAWACNTDDGVEVHLQRLRLFESNWDMAAPKPCDHRNHHWVAGAYGGARRDKYEAKFIRKGGYVPPDKATVMALLGVEHDMTWNGLFECLPPAFTEHVGTQLLAHVEGRVAA